MSTKLFETKYIKKFFDILSKQSRNDDNLYRGYDKLNPDSSLCGRDVFIKRTLSKWFVGKHLVWYCVDNSYNIQYCRYLYITSIRFGYGYSDDINVSYIDYANPVCLSNNIKLSYNKILDLEGEWSINIDKHKQMLDLTMLSIPKKEYVFERYDWDKYPKRGVSKEKALEKIKTTISFICKTEHEAYLLKDKSDVRGIGQLIEVKEIIN